MANAFDVTFQTEQLVEAVLISSSPDSTGTGHLRDLVQKAHEFDCSDVRVLVLGGGTGLSTVVGGNSQLADWNDNPNVGIW